MKWRHVPVVMVAGLAGVAASWGIWRGELRGHGLAGPAAPVVAPAAGAFAGGSDPAMDEAVLLSTIEGDGRLGPTFADALLQIHIASPKWVKLEADWESLGAVGISRETAVDVVVKGFVVGAAMERLLASVPARGALAYTLTYGTIRVCARDDLDYHVARGYAVEDLLPRPDAGEARQRAVRKLIDRVEREVEPGSWVNLGGRYGSAEEIRGELVVSQLERVHGGVAHFFERERWRRGVWRLAWRAGGLSGVAMAGAWGGLLWWGRFVRARRHGRASNFAVVMR